MLEHHATVSAHPGMNRMDYAMRRRYYWPSMVTDIYNTIIKCTTCAQNRLSLRRQTSPLTLFPAAEPLTDLSVNIFGPIPATKASNRFILVITDRFSKLDSNADTRSKRVRVGDYAYTTNHQQKSKLQRRTVGPFVILNADDSTYVIDVNGEERRVNSDHVTLAPRPSTPDETPYPLLDGLDKPESTPPVTDEYVIDRLLSLRRSNGIYSAKVRWFDYGPKDDSWELLEILPRNLVIRFLGRRKRKTAAYSWSIPAPPSRGTCRSPRLHQAEEALVAAPLRSDPKWSPTVLGVCSNSHGEIRITLNWIKTNQSNSVQETLPTCCVRLTLPERTRNIPHDPWLALWRFAEFSEWHGPYTYVWPCPPSCQDDGAPPAPITQGVGSEPNRLLLPSVHDLTSTVEDIMYQSTEATLIPPR